MLNALPKRTILNILLYWLVVLPIIDLVIDEYLFSLVLFWELDFIIVASLYPFLLSGITVAPIIFVVFKYRILRRNLGSLRMIGRILLIVLICFFVSVLVGLLNSIYISLINSSVNTLQPIDRSCSVDSDCKMKQVNCSPCSFSSKGDAVNVFYQTYCPMEVNSVCPMALPDWYINYRAVCESSQCVKVESNSLPRVKGI